MSYKARKLNVYRAAKPVIGLNKSDNGKPIIVYHGLKEDKWKQTFEKLLYAIEMEECLVQRAETDTNKKLKWVTVAHWNGKTLSC